LTYQQTPQYRGEARVLVKPVDQIAGSPTTVPNLETERQIVASMPVASLVKEELQIRRSVDAILEGLSVEAVIESEVMTVAYTSPDPQAAADVANSFSRNYIQYRRDQVLDSLLAAQEAIQGQIKGVQTELTQVIKKIESATTSGDSAIVTTLEGQHTALVARLGVLQQRLQDVQPDRTVELGAGQVIEAARRPIAPASPSFPKNGALGLMLGLAAGVGVAFLRERLDDRFKDRIDVERVVDAPLLATVPKFKSDGKRKVLASTDPRGAATEAFRSLRTSLQFMASQRGVKSVLITSANEGEGKTSTSVNLAAALAQAGKKVVLVSGDLRRPTLEQLFNLGHDAGLSTLLSRHHDNLDAAIKRTAISNLSVLPSGPIPPHPAELLNSPRLGEIIRELESKFEVVVVDSAPVLAVADTATLAPHVGGVVLVIDAASTTKSVVAHARQELEMVGAQIVGAVLNAHDSSSSPYQYASYYSYGDSPKHQKRKSRLFNSDSSGGAHSRARG